MVIRMGNWFTHGFQGVVRPFSRLIFLLDSVQVCPEVIRPTVYKSWFKVFTFLLSFSQFGARSLFLCLFCPTGFVDPFGTVELPLHTPCPVHTALIGGREAQTKKVLNHRTLPLRLFTRVAPSLISPSMLESRALYSDSLITE